MMTPMTLAPWRRRTMPVDDGGFLDLQQTMNELFEDFARGLEAPSALPLPAAPAAWRRAFVPHLDLYETETELRIDVELPGMKEKDFEVQLLGDKLVLKGEKTWKKEEVHDDAYVAERAHGRFHRVVRLPCEVDPEKVEAHYKDGVLHLKLVKAEAGRKNLRKIKVETD